MKLALRGLLVVAVAAVVVQTGAAAPARMHLVATANSFLMWNQHAGLVGIARCDVAMDVHAGECVSGAVERTVDGGRTWHVVLRMHKPIYGVQAIGRNSAIVGSWRTMDRGLTWRRVRSRRTALSPPAVYWGKRGLGVNFRQYAVGNRLHLALRVTRDGGKTWHRQPDPCEKAVAFSASADIVTQKLWWITCTGQPGAGNEEKAIYRTRDGGKTWQAGAAALVVRRRRIHGGLSTIGYAGAPDFASNGFGLLVEDRGLLYVSRDGGMHWRFVPAAHPEVFNGGEKVFADGTAYVLLPHSAFGSARAATQLIVSRDFGRTWRVVRRWRY